MDTFSWPQVETFKWPLTPATGSTAGPFTAGSCATPTVVWVHSPTAARNRIAVPTRSPPRSKPASWRLEERPSRLGHAHHRDQARQRAGEGSVSLGDLPLFGAASSHRTQAPQTPTSRSSPSLERVDESPGSRWVQQVGSLQSIGQDQHLTSRPGRPSKHSVARGRGVKSRPPLSNTPFQSSRTAYLDRAQFCRHRRHCRVTKGFHDGASAIGVIS